MLYAIDLAVNITNVRRISSLLKSEYCCKILLTNTDPNSWRPVDLGGGFRRYI